MIHYAVKNDMLESFLLPVAQLEAIITNTIVNSTDENVFLMLEIFKLFCDDSDNTYIGSEKWLNLKKF